MEKPKFIAKECKHHGETEFVLEGRGSYRCKKCRVESVNKRRRNRKKKAVDHLGGKCSMCGYDKCVDALEFHHLDPTQKEFTIGGSSIAWEKIKEEVEKCMLVCANCHREIHNGMHKNIPL